MTHFDRQMHLLHVISEATTMSEYLKTADVWVILDLIVAEFTSDPMSVQCFDARVVQRAIDLK